MRIRVLNAGRHVVELPVSDAELTLRMKEKFCLPMPVNMVWQTCVI